MSARATSVVGIVLAAGSSRRMGRPKQLLPLAGRPLLQHVLDAAAASRLDALVLVLGHEADAIRAAVRVPTRARVVVNARYAEGQSTSLACGLDAVADLEAAAAAVLLGDQPAIAPALIDAVLEAFLAGAAAAVRPVWRDAAGSEHPGHPVFLARRIWPAAAALQGDRGARALFDAHPEWLRPLPMVGDPPTDIDDPADYRRMASGG